ncbi:MAG: anti-sigma factor antagonist [Oscillospiraceae bacterium]|nr:anti-sigma factor antagonist [Oscillospiraceae bacterium]
MNIATENDKMTVILTGEIDHHTARPIREEIDFELIKKKPAKLILDFSGVTFMDSSGVGLVMGRYKAARAINCRTTVSGLKERDKKIMQMSGLINVIEFI